MNSWVYQDFSGYVKMIQLLLCAANARPYDSHGAYADSYGNSCSFHRRSSLALHIYTCGSQRAAIDGDATSAYSNYASYVCRDSFILIMFYF